MDKRSSGNETLGISGIGKIICNYTGRTLKRDSDCEAGLKFFLSFFIFIYQTPASESLASLRNTSACMASF